MRTSKSLFLSTFLGTTAAFAVTAGQAQETTGGAADEIVVTATPIKDSQQAAIKAKREADNVVDIISADTIGRFPDQNLADSLGRLPGVAIERDQGQARYINFRGAPFRYTAIAFDGIDVPGAENGRVPRFDSIPSVITSAVEANKAITPNMPGEAVSGYINIRTFNPFDKEGFALSAEAGHGVQGLGNGAIEKYNGRISYSNDVFGISAFGSFNGRLQNTDNREFDLEREAGTGELIVNSLDFRSYFVERKDKAFGGRIEFRPAGAVERVFVSTLFSEFIDDEQRNQFVFDLAAGADAIGGSVTPGATGYQPLVIANRLLEYGRYKNSTWTSTLGGDFAFGDWRVEGRVNYTETENSMVLPIPYSAGGTVAASYDLTNVDAPQLSLYQMLSMTPIALSDVSYATTFGYLVGMSLTNDAIKGKLDAERDFTAFGLDTTLKIGAQYDHRDVDGYDTTAGLGAFPSSINIADYNTGNLWSTGFDNTIGATYYDNIGLRKAWDEAVGGIKIAGDDTSLISIKEKIAAGYVMADTKFDWGNIVYGVRVEYTDYTSDGPAIDVSYGDDYVNVLPSVHLNIDLAEDVKFRASASTGLSRPTYNEMRASASVLPTDKRVIGGNPTLEAEKTYGGDVSLEWYFAPASLVSLGAFYRHVDNVIYADSTTVDGGIYLPTAAGENWTLSGFVNGQNGSLAGLELNFIGQLDAFLPEALQGFGVTGNITMLDSEFETNSGAKFSLPGTSDYIYNASVYYERYGLSLRVNYQYRDDWLSTTENDSLAEYWAAEKRLDASARYVLPASPMGAKVTLFANGNNLTNETDVRYIGDRSTPNQVESYGRYFVAGVRIDY